MEISKLILLLCSLNKLLCTVCRGEIKGMGWAVMMPCTMTILSTNSNFKLHPLDKFLKALDD